MSEHALCLANPVSTPISGLCYIPSVYQLIVARSAAIKNNWSVSLHYGTGLAVMVLVNDALNYSIVPAKRSIPRKPGK